MPGIDGFEVCSRIKNTQKYWFDEMKKLNSAVRFKARRDCPVVAITAFFDNSVQL
jgi:CheY-like chemotaxis protein